MLATMSRLLSSISILLLTACPGDIVFPDPNESASSSSDTHGMSSTSSPTTGDVSDATGSSGGESGSPVDCVELTMLSPSDIEQECAAFPWGNPACSTRTSPLPSCGEVIVMLSEMESCAAITVCDYEACAAAMEAAPCGSRPAACDPILDCIAPEPPHVCSPGFCDDFHTVGLAAGLDPEFADELGKVCAWDPCFACSEVAKACELSPCPALEAKCEAEMATCDCG